MKKMPLIAFCGMTHLGINSAVASAAKGFDTLCFDCNASLINKLSEGTLPVVEPQLDELFSAHQERLKFTSDVKDLAACDVVYIAPDIPTDDEGNSNLDGIRSLLDLIIPVLDSDITLVILSQVPPGFTRQITHPAGLLFCQVETLIFGRAMERALYPERIIVGNSHPEAPLPDSYQKYLSAFGCSVLTMRYESAELAKISINMCLVASISVANTMAELCENIGADWSEIAPSLKLDRRIGEFSYINPGLGIAGGNLERDLNTVMRLSDEHQTDGSVVASWVSNSRHRKGWASKALRHHVLNSAPDAQIAVLGLAYKENTHSTKNSPALALLDDLAPLSVTVFDPVVSANEVNKNIRFAKSALHALEGADAVAIMTPWPEFGDIPSAEFVARMRGKTVIDPYRTLNQAEIQDAGLAYVTLGVAPATIQGQ